MFLIFIVSITSHQDRQIGTYRCSGHRISMQEFCFYQKPFLFFEKVAKMDHGGIRTCESLGNLAKFELNKEDKQLEIHYYFEKE